MSFVLGLCAALGVAGVSLAIACLAVALREDQIRRAWAQDRRGCIRWLEHLNANLPETFRD